MINRKTFAQSLDPRTKLFTLVVLAAQTLLLESHWAIIASAFFALVGIVLSPISLRSAVQQARKVLWFVLFITITNTLARSGEVIFNIWGMYGTYEGLVDGLQLSARIVLVLFLSYLFGQTTSTTELLDGVETTLAYFRKQTGSSVALLSLTLNFVPLLIRSAHRIKKAQIARGADVDSSLLAQLRFASSAAVPLFVSAFRASQHLAEAMEVRGYNAAWHRTQFAALRFKQRDAILISILLVEFIAVASLA
jgi:energy-coupling factor transport system permease protein